MLISNRQKKIPLNVTLSSVFDADFDLNIRVENIKKKRKRIEKKIRRKKGGGGERNKKNISIKIVRTGGLKRAMFTDVFVWHE